MRTISDHSVWLARFIKGDEQALAELHDDFYDTLVLYCYQKIGDRCSAEEIASDCYLKLWQYAKKNPLTSLEDIKRFLYHIARNQCVSHLRKSKNQENAYNLLLETQQEADVDLKHQIEAEIIKRVRQRIEELPLSQKRTVKLFYFENLKMTEIAKTTNVEINTSFRLKSRAIKSLREKVNPLAPSYFKSILSCLLACQFL